MRRCLVLLFFVGLIQFSWAQLLLAPDTLRSEQRVLGPADSLLQFMSGFSSPFFISPQQETPSLWALFKPGLAPLSAVSFRQNNLVFSALPHLGFAYGFGAQGSQRLQLVYQQHFATNTLLNIRYDRHQQAGFIRSSNLSQNALDIQIAQHGKRYRALASFSNLSNERQWSGGIANWSQIGLVSSALLPVVKNNSRTFQQAYQAKIEAAYFLSGDSTAGLRLTTSHVIDNSERRYEETDSLELYYTQLNLSTDSCRDVFSAQIWQHQLGIAFVQKNFLLHTALSLKRLFWQDTQFAYDTTEINLVNYLTYQFGKSKLLHQSTINILGAGGGVQADTRLRSNLSFGNFELHHIFLRAWPELMQRSYYSNLTNYQVAVPQLQQSMFVAAKLAVDFKQIKSLFSLAFMHNQQVYRFNSQLMNWQLVGPQSAIEASLDLSYVRKGWRIATRTAYIGWQVVDQHVLPPLTTNLHLQWSGGVFKNKQLKLHAGATVQAMYGGVFTRIAYLPYLETLDWQTYENAALNPVQQLFNAKADLILEVKTFRFFVQATNMLGWIDPSASLFEALPYPSMQIRIGLTWDFWN